MITVGIKNIVVKISHSEYKDVLLKTKCLRHLMNRIQSNNNKVGAKKINKISLSCFDGKVYILNNGYDRLVLGC